MLLSLYLTQKKKEIIWSRLYSTPAFLASIIPQCYAPVVDGTPWEAPEGILARLNNLILTDNSRCYSLTSRVLFCHKITAKSLSWLCYGLDSRQLLVWFLAKAKFFSVSANIQSGSVSLPAFFSVGTSSFSLGLQWLGCTTNHSYYYYYYYYLLQLGCHPVAVVILHVYEIWNWLLLNLSRQGYMRSM